MDMRERKGGWTLQERKSCWIKKTTFIKWDEVQNLGSTIFQCPQN